jgi:hypothetical protein
MADLAYEARSAGSRETSSSKEEASLNVTEWFAEAKHLVSFLPDSFSEIRKGKIGKWSDAPFTHHSEDGKDFVSIPSEPPRNEKQTFVAGLILTLAEQAGVEVVPCTAPHEGVWQSIEILGDSLSGVLYCLKQDKILPVANKPKPIKVGFDFATWYCFSAASGENSENTFVSVKRVTSLLDGVTSTWGSKGNFPNLSRVTAFVRVCCAKNAHKLGRPKEFLKNEGYFLEKLVGRKPLNGLYTDLEFDIMKARWRTKTEFVSKRYSQIPDTFGSIPGKKPLATILELFHQETPKDIKDIEDTKVKRIPYLLVRSGHGKSSRQEVAKGSSLIDKIRTTGCGPHPRVVPKILWSPTIKITRDLFTDSAIRLARDIIQRGKSYDEYKLALAKISEGQARSLHDADASIRTAASLITEGYAERRGEPSWDSLVS